MADVANRLGTTVHSLYAWVKRYGPDSSQHQAQSDENAEIRRLRKELQRVTKERDILKKPRCTSQASPTGTPLLNVWPVRWMSKVHGVHPSGYFGWLPPPPKANKRNGVNTFSDLSNMFGWNQVGFMAIGRYTVTYEMKGNSVETTKYIT